MNALRRVGRAPGLIVLIAGFQLLTAAAFSVGVRTAIGHSMGDYAVPADGHLLAAVFELRSAHPGLLGSYQQTLVGSSLIALLFFTLLAPVIIYRLAAPRTASRLAASAIAGLPAVIVTTLWHLLPRILLLAAATTAANYLLAEDAWGLVAVAVLALTMGYCSCALDLARCHVLLHGARRFHFETALRGYLEALRRPAVLLPSLGFSICQWSCAGGMLAVAISAAGAGSSIWWIRGLALIGVVCGLARVAVAVEAGRPKS